MSKQHSFDFAEPAPLPAHCVTRGAAPPPTDPNVDDRDMPRLKGQNAEILALLKSKPEVSNTEINAISIKHTSRLSDIRQAGYTINARRGEGGVWWYSLGESK